MVTYEDLVEFRNKEHKYGKYMHAKTVEIADGYGKCIMEVQDAFTNPVGSVHGGAIFSLADMTAGAASTCKNTRTTTVNCTMNYLKPALHVKKLISEARRIKSGKTIEVYETEVKDEKGTLLATGTFTYFNLGGQLIPD
ncbi:MAG: PaaI family thioesterase [Eubacteriales bacterium]|nr:PaaI family thioesterase [Eubacteriales bacterium]